MTARTTKTEKTASQRQEQEETQKKMAMRTAAATSATTIIEEKKVQHRVSVSSLSQSSTSDTTLQQTFPKQGTAIMMLVIKKMIRMTTLIVMITTTVTQSEAFSLSPSSLVVSTSSSQRKRYSNSRLYFPPPQQPHRQQQQQKNYQQNHRSSHSPASTTARFSASSAAVVAVAAGSTSSNVGSIYMMLLALQFATQPILTRKFAAHTKLQKTTYVFFQDVARLTLALSCLVLTGSVNSSLQGWSVRVAIKNAGIPSCLYVLQNYCSFVAYQHLSPITYNVLNQFKTLSAALFCYCLMGPSQAQTHLQIVALLILVLSALVMEGIVKIVPENSKTSKKDPQSTTAILVEGTDKVIDDGGKQSNNSSSSTPILTSTSLSATATAAVVDFDTYSRQQQSRRQYILFGIVPVLIASTTSGLAGAWTQRCLQTTQHANSLLLSIEMAFFSSVFLGAGLFSRLLFRFIKRKPLCEDLITTRNNDMNSNDDDDLDYEDCLLDEQQAAEQQNPFTGWTWRTWIPLLTNATGGLLVGLVTKYAGTVNKGFALIVGLFLSGIFQNYLADNSSSSSKGGGEGEEKPHAKVTVPQWIGGGLAAFSLWLHHYGAHHHHHPIAGAATATVAALFRR